jgi:FAD/FMN-containing dehydrogenase
MIASEHTTAPADSRQRDRLQTDALRQQVQGAILEPGDSEYDEARQIWNGMIDRRPALIVLPETADDVAHAVHFARSHGFPLTIRGCGHNIAGTAIVDDGLMISFARMKAVHVDPDAARVRVQPGADWGVVDRATEPYGLVVPGGVISTTGVAGFTLGGGFGWLTRKYGYTSDSLLRATVVTVDGEIVEASETSHPDLFWAIRGGGGNFGVVTEFEFAAQRLGPEVAAGLALWPMDEAHGVIEHYRRLTAIAPPEFVNVLVFRVAPPAPFLPESVHGTPVVGIASVYAGPPDEGMRHLEQVRSFATPLADTFKPKPFREHQSFLDSGQPYGRRYYWKSVYLSDFTDGVRDALLARATTFSSPLSSVLLPHLGSSVVPPGQESAVGNRDAQFLVNYQASWEDPAEDDRHIGWARENYDAMAPHASGQYVNFMTEEEVADPARRVHEPDVYARLAQIKRRYDPDNVLRFNKNVRPA